MSTTTVTSLPTAADLRAAVRAAFDAIGFTPTSPSRAGTACLRAHR